MMKIGTDGNSQIQQLWLQRRQSISEMIGSIQNGDMATAQKDLGTVQQVDASLGIDDSGSTGSSPASVKHRIDFSSLFSAVQSGDLSAAQNAWGQIQAGRAQDADGDRDGGGAFGGLAKDITSLLSAVSQSDASGMQTAATAVAKDLQSLFGDAAPADGSTAPTSSAAPQPNASATDTTDPRQTLFDDLKSLLAAAQSGDVSGAQTAQQKLVQDLQSASGSNSGATGPMGGHHHHHHGQSMTLVLMTITPAQQASTATDGSSTSTA